MGKFTPWPAEGGEVLELGQAYNAVPRSGIACGREDCGRDRPLGVLGIRPPPARPLDSEELGELRPDVDEANVDDLNAGIVVSGGLRIVPSPANSGLAGADAPATCKRVKLPTTGGEVEELPVSLALSALVRPREPGVANARLS